MKDNQNIYLNKVVEFIVRDTKIFYSEDKVRFPFQTFSDYGVYDFRPKDDSYIPFFYSPLSYTDASVFEKYCKDTYGLTDQEIIYVWKGYIKRLRIMLYER